MNKTSIPWTDYTWNPVTGCTPCSIGCENCYAQALLRRFKKPTTVTLHPERLDEPKHLRKPSCIFVCSMSDLFHKDVPDDFIDRVFAVMALTPWHTYQQLTKRHNRAAKYHVTWPLPNVWLGVTIENQQAANVRLGNLLGTKAAIRFVSCEPLLGPVRLSLTELAEAPNGEVLMRCENPERRKWPSAIRWVIVGGETGPKARPMNLDWARSIRDQCQEADIPFFFKQQGGRKPFDGETLLDGREWKEFPNE